MRTEKGTSPTAQSRHPLRFLCSDVHADCTWEVSGGDEQQMRRAIEQHARERHNVNDFTDEMWNGVRTTFRRNAA